MPKLPGGVGKGIDHLPDDRRQATNHEALLQATHGKASERRNSSDEK